MYSANFRIMNAQNTKTEHSENLPDCLHGFNQAHLSAGTQIFKDGDPCQQFFYLLSGTVRVDLTSHSGRQVLLYTFGAGETCVLTTATLLAAGNYNATATAEDNAIAITVPSTHFHDLMNNSQEFRTLVFRTFSNRLTNMMTTIEAVTFQPIEHRLAQRLLTLSKGYPDDITITHEQLATDLGSAREVISRKLALWEKTGIVERRRGGVRIVDHIYLKRLTAEL